MRVYAVGDEPVPGFKIIRRLGAGGCGTVWVAKTPDGVDIALKIIDLPGQGLKEFRAVSLVRRVRHPNLVPIYAFWLKDEYGNFLDSSARDSVNLRGSSSELVIAMGLGDSSLAQRLGECRWAFAERHGLPDATAARNARLQQMGGAELAGLPVDELLQHMFGAAKAIDFLNQPIHNLGTGEPAAIQHCGIKPGNLLIVGADVQVCDYGLARIADDGRSTQVAGATAYIAPELIAGMPVGGTDQYLLAITYYELRTGRLPFNEGDAFRAHVMGQLDFGLVSPPEQDVLRRATHMRPAQRYPQAIEMVMALLGAITASGLPPRIELPAPPPPPPPVPAPPTKLTRATATPAAAATLVTTPMALDELIREGIELVPGHKLEQMLGRGGSDEVWSAKMPDKTRCALKIVRKLDAGQAEHAVKCLKMILTLDQDRLIRLQGYWFLAADGSLIPDDQVGQPGAPQVGALIVSTEQVQQNLLQRWDECHEQGFIGIPKEELVPYVYQAAEAIDLLNSHEPAIVHRDIKPEHILLTKNHQVKLSGFGRAMFVDGINAVIPAASVGLTLAYAAPELFRNLVTRRTDEYSLAVTYYRVRVGRLPFPDGTGPIPMMQAHAVGALAFTGIGEAEQAILRQACALDPQARFGSCVGFVAALATAIGVSRPASSIGPGRQKRPAAPEVKKKHSTQEILLPESPPPAEPVPPAPPEPPSAQSIAGSDSIRDQVERSARPETSGGRLTATPNAFRETWMMEVPAAPPAEAPATPPEPVRSDTRLQIVLPPGESPRVTPDSTRPTQTYVPPAVVAAAIAPTLEQPALVNLPPAEMAMAPKPVVKMPKAAPASDTDVDVKMPLQREPAKAPSNAVRPIQPIAAPLPAPPDPWNWPDTDGDIALPPEKVDSGPPGVNPRWRTVALVAVFLLVVVSAGAVTMLGKITNWTFSVMMQPATSSPSGNAPPER